MKQLLFRHLTHRKGSSLFYILAFVLIFVISPIVFVSLQSVAQRVESDITYYGRGSYDLLVRPENSKGELEKERGIVPENYIGFGNGGISVEQWESIKNRNDIEIAAPVASLGYFSGIKNTIGFTFPEESTRVKGEYKTSDGINEYSVSEEYLCIVLEVEKPIRPFIDKFDIIASNSLSNYCTFTTVQFPLPSTYHLLVGIDPIEEGKLTGIVFNGIDEEQLNQGHAYLYLNNFNNATPIPVLESKKGTISLYLSGSIDTLGIGPQETKKYRNRLGLVDDAAVGNFTFLNEISTDEYKHLLQELTTIPAKHSESLHVNFDPYLHPFNQEKGVRIHNDGSIEELEADGEFYTELDLLNSIKHYRAGQPIYKEENGQLTIKKLGEEFGVPLYREIEQVGPFYEKAIEEDTDDLIMIIDPVGEFDAGEWEETLAASPLGIYQYAPVTYKKEDGEEIVVQATTVPGSFVTPAAYGVTNIASSTLIKGETPIDAIRVKVSGITSYTKEAAEKIDKIAEEIRNMGLQVDIIAGSSLQKIDLHVEDLGLVSESWTTLGAAGSIVTQWNITNLILGISFLVVAITYILNRIIFWRMTKQNEISIYYLLGWERKDILKLFRSEIAILTIISWIFSILLLTIFQGSVNSTMYIWNVLLGVFTLFIMTFISFTNKVMKSPSVVKRRNLAKKERIEPLFWKGIKFYKTYIQSPFIQLIIVSTISSFAYLSLTETADRTRITILGEYVNVQTSSMQILILISIYLLTIFTLIESINSLLMTRDKEISMFKIIGWKHKHIFNLFMKEISVWSFVAITMGSGLSLILFTIFFNVSQSVFLLIILSTVGNFGLVIVIAALNLRIQLYKKW